MASRKVLIVAALVFAAGTAGAPALAQKVGKTQIGGVVTGPKGPEAGVWVIAETRSLPTGYAKVVVTDDRGRYLIPDLPQGSYQVWARGYGLKDSPKSEARPGRTVNLKAAAATPKEAAELYPGMYWYSLLKIPDAGEFPGTGEKGNGIAPTMKTQQAWIDSVKNSCQSCHALGTHGVRVVPEEFRKEGDSFKAWAKRTQAGQAMANMALTLGYMGPERALKQYADWTDRIAGGELPFAKPERPKGVERNVVVTMWDWSSNKAYLHDAISTDKNNPTVNGYGKVYGSPEESTDNVPVLDPVSNTVSVIHHPFRDPKTPSQLTSPKGVSAYWSSEPIWDGHTSIHNPMMDREGRVWFTARIRPIDAQPDYCKAGGSHPSAKFAPLGASFRQLSMYDPKADKWTLINTCFSTHHLYFDAKDPNYTLWASAGGPQSGVVGWLNTKMFLETGDEAKSQGWAPIVVDSNGNGVRDQGDLRLPSAFYGIMPSTVDSSVWGQSMDVGFSRQDVPGYLEHFIPGANAPETGLTEVFLPPYGGFGSRGLDMGTDGIVWTVLSSGHVASFDRTKCKAPMSGPIAATGKHCPAGWTLYTMPGPQFKGLDLPGSANHAYYIWVDRYNTFGLGKNVPIASTNGGESLLAVVKGELIEFRVPYPMGFFTKNVDGRIDDAKAGWKGRGLWTTSGTRTNFHNEGGTANWPKVYHLQLRPNPLAG